MKVKTILSFNKDIFQYNFGWFHYKSCERFSWENFFTFSTVSLHWNGCLILASIHMYSVVANPIAGLHRLIHWDHSLNHAQFHEIICFRLYCVAFVNKRWFRWNWIFCDAFFCYSIPAQPPSKKTNTITHLRREKREAEPFIKYQNLYCA